ncbi:MAG: type II toxin-antitoxin system HipA family toxin [Opitutae bacterium]|nr:type II toxin-antitoxin system HipA family toxin [Opitutae bacterium]
MATEFVDIIYQGQHVCEIYWDAARQSCALAYTNDTLKSGYELSPIHLKRRRAPYQFNNLDASFTGLPGMLADCLPDTYGNALIDTWLRSQDRDPASFTPVERLCYMGARAMGALEFRPSMRSQSKGAQKVEVERLIELASQALQSKQQLDSKLENQTDLEAIIQVGTSAGGARAKAVIAWNPDTNEVRSGQSDAPQGFEHWLLKLDGVDASFEGIKDPKGYGRIEYAYSLMARDAGIDMAPCRLLEEGTRAHFMTQRFDRIGATEKLHYASLFGINHMAYTAPGSHKHSYEDYFSVIDQLNIHINSKREAFARMCFNVLAFNKDDHVKNFGFLMSRAGDWNISPAFDLSYAHSTAFGAWTRSQQMSVNGKREDITTDDLITCGRNCNVGTLPKLKALLRQVSEAITNWPAHAEAAGVDTQKIDAIQTVLKRDC